MWLSFELSRIEKAMLGVELDLNLVIDSDEVGIQNTDSPTPWSI
jgi:hypothetical protein